MSARKEKQLRQMVRRCEESVRQCDDDAHCVIAMYDSVSRSMKDQEERFRSAIRSERKRRQNDIRSVKATAAVGLAVVTALASVALVRAYSIQEPEPVQYEVIMTPTAVPAETAVAAPTVVLTDDPYREEIPLNAVEQDALRAASEEFNVDYPLAIALVERESQFQNIAGDSGNSIGYMQINRFYHTDLMEDIGTEDLWDPEDNFRTGLAILSREIQTNGTLHEALMCYNMGPAGARKCWDRGLYSSEYSRDIVDRAGYWENVVGQ